MIENNIRALRQAARVTSNDKVEKVWCVVAGNVQVIDDIAYEAIASKKSVKILFREHVILKKARLNIKFDFIMLYGNSHKITSLTDIGKDNGGAAIQIFPRLVSSEPNLMVLVAPIDTLKSTVVSIENQHIPVSVLLKDQSTGFIEVDLNLGPKKSKFLKTALKPLFDVSDVVLSTVLMSVENDEDVEKVQSILTSNKIYVIDFKDIIMED